MYNITGASDVYLLGSQTENPYWIAGNQSTPACTARAAVVERSKNIVFHGVVWCSWFCGLSQGISNFSQNALVSIFGMWGQKGTSSGPLIEGDKPVIEQHFAAALDE